MNVCISVYTYDIYIYVGEVIIFVGAISLFKYNIPRNPASKAGKRHMYKKNI